MSTKETGGNRRERRPGQQRPQPKHTPPEVIYTPGKPFHRNRLILRLLTIVAVVLAICMGMSIFFRVDTVYVTGSEKYDPYTIQQASGIEKGDSLLFFGRSGAAAKIINKLHYVRSVRFEVNLPGTVNIIIEEAPTAYAIQSDRNQWWLITADGRVTEQVDMATAANYTSIVGVVLATPQPGQLAVAAENEPEGDTPVVITGADRLRAALAVVQALEANEILGQATSVDVSNLQALEFWYGKQYQVKLGDSQRLNYKIAAAKQAISQMSPYQSGVLDASFTTLPDRVGFYKFP